MNLDIIYVNGTIISNCECDQWTSSANAKYFKTGMMSFKWLKF